jgi:putative ABC transport system substrate-binding protein
VKRRRLIAAFRCALLAPVVARAQQAGKVYRLAVLTRAGASNDASGRAGLRYWRAWRVELERLGYVEGKNLILDRRSLADDPAQMSEVIRDVVKSAPDAIFAPSQNVALALKEAGITIPVVMTAVNPVGSRLASSIARPGGNMTGPSLDAGLEITAKRLALLREAYPAMSRIGVPTLRAYWEGGMLGGPIREAAQQLSATAVGGCLDVPVTETDYRRVFADMRREGVDSLYVPLTIEHLQFRQLIAALALEAKWPAVCAWRENAEAGALMAYSVDLPDIFRRAARYLDRILKGARPGELPIEQPTSFELVINLRTAKSLGLAIPPAILARADEVIE